MSLKFALSFVAFSLVFISSPAHGDDCSDALMAESCACSSGTTQSTGKNGDHADNKARSKAAAVHRLAKAAARDSKQISGP